MIPFSRKVAVVFSSKRRGTGPRIGSLGLIFDRPIGPAIFVAEVGILMEACRVLFTRYGFEKEKGRLERRTFVNALPVDESGKIFEDCENWAESDVARKKRAFARSLNDPSSVKRFKLLSNCARLGTLAPVPCHDVRENRAAWLLSFLLREENCRNLLSFRNAVRNLRPNGADCPVSLKSLDCLAIKMGIRSPKLVEGAFKFASAEEVEKEVETVRMTSTIVGSKLRRKSAQREIPPSFVNSAVRFIVRGTSPKEMRLRAFSFFGPSIYRPDELADKRALALSRVAKKLQTANPSLFRDGGVQVRMEEFRGCLIDLERNLKKSGETLISFALKAEGKLTDGRRSFN
jgi:hypothetical protein